MKKQIILLPLLLGLTLPLVSCQGGIEKTDLRYGQMMSNDVTIIDYLTLKEKIDNKDNFILTVYTNGCTCWSNFKRIANQYIKANHVEIFAIEHDNFRSSEGSSLDTFSLTFVSGGVSLHIMKDGKVKAEIADSKSSVVSKLTSLESFLEENVILPKMFYISLSQVDELYKSNETSLLYFARSNCFDCKYLDNNFLREYSLENNMYILDCENIGIREYDDEGNLTEESATKWAEFKINYGLAKDKNEMYGYDIGYVPTLFLLKGDGSSSFPSFLSGAVYFNDEIAKDSQGYYIANSYYTNTRVANLNYTDTVLKDRRLNESEVDAYGSYYSWNHQEAAKVYDDIIKAFLDESLSKVTHEGFNIE